MGSSPKRGRVWALALLAAALLAHAPGAQAECTVKVEEGRGTIECNGDVPAETADGREWDAALKDLDDATSISAEFFDVTFDEESFNRALGLALQTGGASTGSVAVLLDGCSLEGQKFDAAAVSEVPGSRQWTITLKDSKITSNTLNMTGAVAVQDAADVTLKILSSTITDNRLGVLGAAAVGAAGRASIQVAERSVVSGNRIAAFGALGVGGDGELSMQLSAANVTDNVLADTGLVATGGTATFNISGDGAADVALSGNTRESRSAVFTEQPLVTAALDVLLGSAFSDAGTFDLPAALEKLQGQLCAALADAPSSSTAAEDVAAALAQRAVITPGGAPGGLLGGASGDLSQVVEQLAARLCDGSAASSSLSLGELAPALEEAFKGGVAGLAAQADSLLGTDGALAGLARAAANGTLSSPQQLGPALDGALEKLLTSPAGDTAAGWVSDALSELAAWLDTPIGGGGGSGDNEAKPEPEPEAEPEAGASGPASGGEDTEEEEEEQGGGGDSGFGDFGDVLGGLVKDLIGSVSDAAGGLFGLGQSGEGGSEEGAGGGDAADNPLAAVGGIVQSLVDAFDGGEDGSSATPGDLLNQLVGAVGGALGKNTTAALQDVDITALVPVLTAVLRDPAARGELPALVSSLVGGGSPSMQDLGPIISAVLNDKEAAKAIPSLLALMNGLGVPLQLN